MLLKAVDLMMQKQCGSAEHQPEDRHPAERDCNTYHARPLDGFEHE